MQRKLDAAAERDIKIRVFVSRVTGRRITQAEIARSFGISRSTLQRYEMERLREMSRIYARNQTRRIGESRRIAGGKCSFCEVPWYMHPRCGYCTILLHSANSGLGGASHNGKHCRACFDLYEKAIMSDISILDIYP